MAKLTISPFLTSRQFQVCFLLSSFVVILAYGESFDQGFHRTADPKILGLQKEKMCHIRLYWHDIVSGPHPSAIQVVPPVSNKSQTSFGLVRIFDNALTQGPELSSKVVARAQGYYASASQGELGFLMTQNFAFVGGDFNGSTLTLVGRNPALNKVRELPVIGGTGAFRFARGYAQLTTHWFNASTGDATVEYNIYALHY